MRPINIIGLLYCFLPLYERYKSRRSLIVFMNGILYHTFDSSNTLRNYDIIYIMDNGRIIESGKYDLLSQNSNIFNRLLNQN